MHIGVKEANLMY